MVFLHTFSLVNKYVTLIEPIRNAAHVCHPRINKQSALFRGWFIASRECLLPTDWSVHWLNWSSPHFSSQQQQRLCLCYRTHKFLKPSFNLHSFRFSEFHACTGPTDRAIVLNLLVAWFEAFKGSPTDDRDSSSRDFLFLLIVHITLQPLLAYVNHPSLAKCLVNSLSLLAPELFF